MQVINNCAVFDTKSEFTIGLSKDVLLVQRAKTYKALDVSKAFLIHRDHFQPSIHRVVVVSEENAWLIRSLVVLDKLSQDATFAKGKMTIASGVKRQYIAHTRSRRANLIDDNAHLELFAV